uniref:Ig-like domain-containing protein n=1 Tax=Myripristis murdjan TaxID=586833 RepID=A0A667WY37_9TELE
CINIFHLFHHQLCLFLFLCASVPPVFKQKITPLDINIGGHAKFECEIEDAPSVTFKWYKSGIEIKHSEKYRILSRQTSSSLELLNPAKADSGDYTCKASNQHGSDSCSASLIVTGKSPVGHFQSLFYMCVRERELYIYVYIYICIYIYMSLCITLNYYGKEVMLFFELGIMLGKK